MSRLKETKLIGGIHASKIIIIFLSHFPLHCSLPGRGQPCDWLQKRDSRGITELSYLEVGLGSQSIHMEFEDGPVAYTLLVRDSVRCKRFFSLFTGKTLPPTHTHCTCVACICIS